MSNLNIKCPPLEVSRIFRVGHRGEDTTKEGRDKGVRVSLNVGKDEGNVDKVRDMDDALTYN